MIWRLEVNWTFGTDMPIWKTVALIWRLMGQLNHVTFIYGGKQADVVDITERFCTKMCVFSACSALKLSTNVIEWMIFSIADYLEQFLVSKANNYKLYKYCKQTRWPIRVHLKFQRLNRIMYKTPTLVVEALLVNVPYRALTNKWSLLLVDNAHSQWPERSQTLEVTNK